MFMMVNMALCKTLVNNKPITNCYPESRQKGLLPAFLKRFFIFFNICPMGIGLSTAYLKLYVYKN